MLFSILKKLFDDRAVATRILRGPFRGASPVMNPRHSMRKVLGLYEHELNPWIDASLRQVNRVIDVGANDGYFTFGCAAAFRRLGQTGEVIAIECDLDQLLKLMEALPAHEFPGIHTRIIEGKAGAKVEPGLVTLDALDVSGPRERTLIKIDVEGAELDVLAGARLWFNPSNFFLIEVHCEDYLEPIVRLFAESGHGLRQINQRPLPLVGGEYRAEANWWLVSETKAK